MNKIGAGQKCCDHHARLKILKNLLHILKHSVTWKRNMGFSLGEPERIYNMRLSYHAQLKNYVEFVTYPEALSNVETLHGLQPG